VQQFMGANMNPVVYQECNQEVNTTTNSRKLARNQEITGPEMMVGLQAQANVLVVLT
jgi:hypothetical protein